MKLNPPASSSDLDRAREIAQRLYERRVADRQAAAAAAEQRLFPPPSPAKPPAAALLSAPPLPPKAAPPAETRKEKPPAQAPAAQPAPPPVVRVAAPRPTPAEPVTPRAPRPQPAAVPAQRLEPALPQGPSPQPAPSPPLEVAGLSAAVEEAAELPEVPPPSWDEASALTPGPMAALAGLTEAPTIAEEPAAAADDDRIEIEETEASVEELVGEAELPPAEETAQPALSEYEAAPAPSPFDQPSPIESVSEELFDAPLPPSWGDIVESCMAIAHARGAMLVDASAQVFATRGRWPEPGADAIASKLVAMMEKALKDAPTRSVSAPLGGLHLTAWRVPLGPELITAAFIADAPLRAEVRAPIDAEIHRGTGA